MAATATVVAQLNSTSAGAQTATTASFTPTANSKLVVVAIALNNNHTTAKVWSISGGSLSWQDGALGGPFESLVGANFDCEIDVEWADVGSSPSSMTVAVDAYTGTSTAWYGVTVYEVLGATPGVFGNIQAVDFDNPGAADPTLALGSAKSANSVLLAVVAATSDGAAPAWDAAPSGWTRATLPTGTDGINVSSLYSTTDADAALSGYGTTSNTTEMWGVLIEIGEYLGLVEQKSVRWGEDDGNEAAHTWAAAQDADLTAPVGSKLLRFLLQTTDDRPATAWELQHQIDGTGGYANTPVGATTTPTIAWGAAGTDVDSTGDPNPSYPAGGSSLSEYILITSSKPSTANGGSLADPSGWTRRGEMSGATDGDTGGYGTSQAAEEGNMNLYVLTKDSVAGTEGGTALGAVNHTGQNNATATILRLDKSHAGTTSWAVATGKDTNGGNVSVTTGTIDLAPGDVLIWALSIPTDITTPSQFTSHAISASGITFDTVTEIVEIDSTQGTDQGGYFARTTVLSGSGTVACTITATAGGTTTNVRGPIILLRARPPAAYNNSVYVAPSSNIAAGGEATTQRMTGGTGTFTTGRRWDDENGTDTIDVVADGNTELEFCVALAGLSDAQYVELRLDPADTYTKVAKWTVGSGGTNAQAEVASATLSALNATTEVAPAAGEATATLAALDAQASVAPAAGEATASFSAHDATVEVSPTAELASATLSALDAQVEVAPSAEVATASFSAHDATVTTGTSTDAQAEVASAAWSSHDPSTAVAPEAATAIAAYSAHDAQSAVGAAGGVAAATLSALDATTEVAPTAGAATATFSAHDATVTTGSSTNAPAELASATLSAHDATVETSSSATAGAAQAALTALDAQAAVDTNAGAATASFSAHDATVTTVVETNAQAEVAEAAFTAHDATVVVLRLAPAEVATAILSAHDATVIIQAPGVAYAQTAYARWTAYGGRYRATIQGGGIPVLLEPQTLTVISPASSSPSAYGNEVLDYVTGERRTIIGWLQQDNRTEGSDPGRTPAEERWLLVTNDYEVSVRDRIEWLEHPLGPIVFEVEGPPEPAWRPGSGFHHTEATLRKVAG